MIRQALQINLLCFKGVQRCIYITLVCSFQKIWCYCSMPCCALIASCKGTLMKEFTCTIFLVHLYLYLHLYLISLYIVQNLGSPQLAPRYLKLCTCPTCMLTLCHLDLSQHRVELAPIHLELVLCHLKLVTRHLQLNPIFACMLGEWELKGFCEPFIHEPFWIGWVSLKCLFPPQICHFIHENCNFYYSIKG